MGLIHIFKTKKRQVVYNGQMELLFCFLKNTFTCADMLDIMQQCEEFKPIAVSKRTVDDPVSLATKVYADLKNADAESNELLWSGGLVFLDENSKRRVFFHTGPGKEKFQAIYWRYDSPQFLESTLFKKLIAHNNFIAAYCFNDDDDFIQNLPFIEIYKQRGIKPVGIRKNWMGQREVDIYKNPGKSYSNEQTWLKSSWRMWFGKNFYSIVSKEKIQSFEGAFSIKELDHAVTSVQAYQNHEDFDKPENRRVQMKFRKWMEYEKMDDTPLR